MFGCWHLSSFSLFWRFSGRMSSSMGLNSLLILEKNEANLSAHSSLVRLSSMCFGRVNVCSTSSPGLAASLDASLTHPAPFSFAFSMILFSSFSPSSGVFPSVVSLDDGIFLKIHFYYIPSTFFLLVSGLVQRPLSLPADLF